MKTTFLLRVAVPALTALVLGFTSPDQIAAGADSFTSGCGKSLCGLLDQAAFLVDFDGLSHWLLGLFETDAQA